MIRRVLDNLEEYLLALLLALMVLLVFIQVVSRYALHRSLSYTEELVRYLFVWSTFLGAGAALKRDRHLKVDVLVQRLPEGWRKVSRRCALGGTLLFFTVLGGYGLHIVHLQIQTGQTTAALGMPAWWIGLSVPVGCALLIIRAIQATQRKQHTP